MLRKKLGKEPVKTSVTAVVGTNSTGAGKPALQGLSMDKQKLTQIFVQKQKIETKERQLVSKLAQGSATRKYHREFSGVMQLALAFVYAKRPKVITKQLFTGKENKQKFKPEDYI